MIVLRMLFFATLAGICLAFAIAPCVRAGWSPAWALPIALFLCAGVALTIWMFER